MDRILEVRTTDGVEAITTGTRVYGVVPVTAVCCRIGSTLIDAGSPMCAEPLVKHLGSRIDTVLLTHEHEDHVGGASRLADAGARVHAPADSLDRLEHPVPLPRFRELAWDRPDPVEAEPLGKAITTADGTFEVIPTPGHNPDHVSFFDPARGWLFSGDAFLGPREELRFAEDLPSLVSSLQRMRALEPERIFPGHGRVVHEPEQALVETLEHYERLHERAWTLREQGGSLASITQEMLGPEGFLRYFSGGEFSKRNLVAALLRLPRPAIQRLTDLGRPGEEDIARAHGLY